MKIIGIGNPLVDVLVRLDDDKLLDDLHLPRGGMQLIDGVQEQEIDQLLTPLQPQKSTGGSAGNAMLALARLGAEVGLIGRVGKDAMGRYYQKNCKEHGIDARLIVGDGVSGVANTFISQDGERTFATHLGEAARLSPNDVTPQLFEGYNLLHIEGYLAQTPGVLQYVSRMAKELGMQVSIDLASYNVVSEHLPMFHNVVRQYVDIVFANEEEAMAFAECTNPEEALNQIATMCKIAVVKLGSKGSCAMKDGKIFRTGIHEVEVIDTTAAGDFFAGGFLYAYSQGADIQRCLETGSLLSSKVIQVIGTQVNDNVWADLKTKI